MTEEPIEKNGSSRTNGRASWLIFAASSALWSIGILLVAFGDFPTPARIVGAILFALGVAGWIYAGNRQVRGR